MLLAGRKFSKLLPKALEDRHRENNLEVAGKKEAFRSKV